MNRIALLVLIVTAGCHAPNVGEPLLGLPTKAGKESILDGILSKESNSLAITNAEQDRPGDIWIDSPYRYNGSRDRRERELSARLLQELPDVLKSRSVTELVHELKVVDRFGGYFSGVAGYVYAWGNFTILQELQSRSKEDLEVLRSMKLDDVQVYDGPSGPADTMEEVIKFQILDKQ